MTMIVSTEELPEPTMRDVDGDSLVWDVHGGLGVAWIPPDNGLPCATELVNMNVQQKGYERAANEPAPAH